MRLRRKKMSFLFFFLFSFWNWCMVVPVNYSEFLNLVYGHLVATWWDRSGVSHRGLCHGTILVIAEFSLWYTYTAGGRVTVRYVPGNQVWHLPVQRTHVSYYPRLPFAFLPSEYKQRPGWVCPCWLLKRGKGRQGAWGNPAIAYCEHLA